MFIGENRKRYYVVKHINGRSDSYHNLQTGTNVYNNGFCPDPIDPFTFTIPFDCLVEISGSIRAAASNQTLSWHYKINDGTKGVPGSIFPLKAGDVLSFYFLLNGILTEPTHNFIDYIEIVIKEL